MNADLVAVPAGTAAEWAPLTFPAYRHLLSQPRAPRHLDQPQATVSPVAVAARAGSRPVGLALADVPNDLRLAPALLSLYVAREWRGRGLGCRLLARVESELQKRGCDRVETTWMTGRPEIARFERTLARRGWSPPETRTVAVRFTPAEAAATRWFSRQRLGAEFEIFPWCELAAAEREELRRSQAECPWIAPDLVPWRYDAGGFDAVSSLGLRHRGRVVAWVINHRIAPGLVRFTCSYIRKDLGRRGKILPLYSAAVERLRSEPGVQCTFVTPVWHASMIRFVQRRCAPWVGYVGETRGAAKLLRPISQGGTS